MINNPTPFSVHFERYWNNSLVLRISTHSPVVCVKVSKHDFIFEINGHVVSSVEITVDDLSTWIAQIRFDFLHTYISSFNVRSSEAFELVQIDAKLSSIFSHSSALIHSRIQNRGAPVAGGYRYLIALQSILWIISNQKILPKDEFWRLSSYCICCCTYRLMERQGSKGIDDSLVLKERIRSLVSSSKPGRMPAYEARWYPSLLFCLAQIQLCHFEIKDAVISLQNIYSHKDEFLEKAPITAYNVSLASCLLTAIYAASRDQRFFDVKDGWIVVMRRYPSVMEVRFGTLHELSVLHSAWMLNLRLSQTVFPDESFTDHRFQPCTSQEVIDLCIRVKIPPFIRQKLSKEYLQIRKIN